MTNKEIIRAIERIAYIKFLEKEAAELREEIINEMNRRNKIKINLGGPTQEDYIKLNYENVMVDDWYEQKVKKLSYRISSNDSNMIRGVDL